MILHTASEVVSLVRKLETESAEFYKNIAGQYGNDASTVQPFPDENLKNIKQVERAYYGSISDALEGGFAFELEADNYTFDTELANDSGYPAALEKAIAIEKLITALYTDTGKSQTLMADVQRVFKILARKRAERIQKLESLLKEA